MVTLQLMGYPKCDIQRAIQIHQNSQSTPCETDFDLSSLEAILLRLKQKENIHCNIPWSPFVAHFDSPAAAQRLQLHDTVDYRYHNGLFILWTVIERSDLVLKLHPAARDLSDDKYDQTVLINLLPAKYTRFAVPKSISHRKSNSMHMTVDQMVDINPPRSGHRGWKSGRITKVDSNSSQIRVQYTLHNDHQVHSYWFHPENTNEVAAFQTRCKKDKIDKSPKMEVIWP